MIFTNLKSARLFVFLLGVSFLGGASSAMAQLFPLMIEDDRPRVMIDRVEIEGESSVPGWLMAQTLEIPTGVLLSAVAASEILTEAERRLKATGRYTDNMVVKLVKGASYPHFVLHIRVEEISTWYWGFDASYVKLENNESGTHTSSTLRTAVYTGNRDWRQTGWNLDLEVLDIVLESLHETSTEFGLGTSKGSNNFNQHLYGFVASAVQKQLWDDLFYFGVMGGLYGISTVTEFDSSYNATLADGRRIRSQTHFSYRTEYILPGVEVVSGVRYKKFSLGAKGGRYAYRPYRMREHGGSEIYYDDVLQSDSGSIQLNSDGKWDFNSEVQLSFAWSDKSGLNLIEPGLDIRGRWSRGFYNYGADAPTFYVVGQETMIIRDNLAASLLAGGRWKFEKETKYNPSVRRLVHLGGRVDYLARQGMVFFGEYYRTARKKNELENVYMEEGSLSLNNRFNAGVRYASPFFIYEIGLGYGASLAGEEQLGLSEVNSNNRRLGF